MPEDIVAESKKIADNVDADVTRRQLVGRVAVVVTALAVVASLFHIYALGLTATSIVELRAIHLMVGLVLTPLLYKGWKSAPFKTVHPIDLLLVLLGVAVTIYVLVEQEGLTWRAGVSPTTGDLIAGITLIFLVIEATRRVIGWPLILVTLVFALYAFFGDHAPGVFAGRSYDYERMVSHIFSVDGIYGIPIGASATFVYLFILFGAFLRASRAGDLFIDMAYAVAGRARGGPAKVAILASSLFGTISGSGIANVVTTGTFTIPLMKRVGYKPYFAGAVESVASTGGQIMPPVMGAGAFLMSEMISVPYSQIAIAAALPALLFYLAVYWMVDFEAAINGLKGLPSSQLPKVSHVMRRWGHLSIPIAVLLYELLIERATPIRSALLSMAANVVVSWLRYETRMGWKQLVKALEEGARGSLEVIAACACAGIVTGLVSLTGVGIKLSSAIIELSGGQVMPALIITMIVTIILSMGLPTTPAYIIAAVVMAPALTKLGVEILPAHLFVFYFACMSAITPPVALVAYPAAGIAGANPMRVGFTAWRLGLAAFIVPFMFVYSPALLLIGPPLQVAWAVATACIGATALAASLSGWLFRRAGLLERALFGVASIALIDPGLVTDTIGFGALGAGVAIQLARRWRENRAAIPQEQ